MDSVVPARGSQDMEDLRIWGYLIPCSSLVPRIDFYYRRKEVSIGRDPDRNDRVLASPKIS